MTATLAEIGKAMEVLNAEQREHGASEFELTRRLDGGWSLSRDGDAAVFLSSGAKTETLRALEAFTDGLRIGARQAVLVETAGT